MAEDIKLSFLDLGKTKIKSEHQLESALLKVADLKLRSERPKEEDVILAVRASRQKGQSSPDFPFPDPVPVSMRHVDIQELSQVDIEWRMLTLCRPSSKLEEDIFTRYVELAKLTRKSRQVFGSTTVRSTPWNVRTYGKSRVPDDWGEETFGDDAHEFCYEYFTRQPIAEDDETNEENQSLEHHSEDISAETGVKRRAPVKKSPATFKKAEIKKSDRLTVPEKTSSPSPVSTPETKVRGRKSRSTTPVSRGGDKSVKKKHKNSVKKKNSKKKQEEEATRRDSS